MFTMLTRMLGASEVSDLQGSGSDRRQKMHALRLGDPDRILKPVESRALRQRLWRDPDAGDADPDRILKPVESRALRQRLWRDPDAGDAGLRDRRSRLPGPDGRRRAALRTREGDSRSARAPAGRRDAAHGGQRSGRPVRPGKGSRDPSGDRKRLSGADTEPRGMNQVVSTITRSGDRQDEGAVAESHPPR
jgi:hypothetical protein